MKLAYKHLFSCCLGHILSVKVLLASQNELGSIPSLPSLHHLIRNYLFFECLLEFHLQDYLFSRGWKRLNIFSYWYNFFIFRTPQVFIPSWVSWVHFFSTRKLFISAKFSNLLAKNYSWSNCSILLAKMAIIPFPMPLHSLVLHQFQV